MAKPIPDGGKRTHQVKVNFNDFEIKKLNEYCKKTGFDKASVLRNGFLGEKVSSSKEIKSFNLLKNIEVVSLHQSENIFKFLDLLKNGNPLILKINNLVDNSNNFLLDTFDAGAYALNANKYRISKNNYLFTPTEIKINIQNTSLLKMDNQIVNALRNLKEFKNKFNFNSRDEKIKEDYKILMWKCVDKLRGYLDYAEYKHLVFGLILLKYLSDTFVEQQNKILEMVSNPDSDYYLGDDPNDHQEALEDRDYYIMSNVFSIPTDARWELLLDKAHQPEIGELIDKALVAIENENPTLRRKLDKRFGSAQLEPGQMGTLINLISTIGFEEGDVFGEVYEYLSDQFASAEGKKAGDFYTPPQIAKTLVAILSPDKGRIYDPCCGIGKLLIQTERFIKANGGRRDDISLYGQESNPNTWRMAAMNLAFRGYAFDLGKEPADTFTRDQHPDKKFNFILANPPLNIADWGGEKYEPDSGLMFDKKSAGIEYYAWLEHILGKLELGGNAGVVLASGSMSSNTWNARNTRKEMVRKDVVEVMVALPRQLFLNTHIPICLCFLTNDKTKRGRDRKGETLFIDAQQFGIIKNSRDRELTDENISKIVATVHAWRNTEEYYDIAGFCHNATYAEIKKKGFILAPEKYVGVSEEKDDSKNIDMSLLLERIATYKEGKENKLKSIYDENPSFYKDDNPLF